MINGTWNPNNLFLVDVWWFPTISYIKIWFIIQVKTTICKWDMYQVPGMNQLGKSSPYFLTVLPSASLWFNPTFVSHHIDTNSDPPKKNKKKHIPLQQTNLVGVKNHPRTESCDPNCSENLGTGKMGVFPGCKNECSNNWATLENPVFEKQVKPQKKNWIFNDGILKTV